MSLLVEMILRGAEVYRVDDLESVGAGILP